ncbi:hypothetical protein ACOME3_009263 [Neoechinorhynchus agilis]
MFSEIYACLDTTAHCLSKSIYAKKSIDSRIGCVAINDRYLAAGTREGFGCMFDLRNMVEIQNNATSDDMKTTNYLFQSQPCSINAVVFGPNINKPDLWMYISGSTNGMVATMSNFDPALDSKLDNQLDKEIIKWRTTKDLGRGKIEQLMFNQAGNLLIGATESGSIIVMNSQV